MLTVTFLTSFGRRPLHALGGVGLFFFGIGTLGMIWLGVLWCLMNVVGVVDPVPIGNRPLLVYSVASMLLGGQALSLGLLAELIVAQVGHSRDAYSVVERCTSSAQS